VRVKQHLHLAAEPVEAVEQDCAEAVGDSIG
jgi:hypothetical protein